jgi:biotin synthase
MMETSMIHHDWTHAEVAELLDRPFHDLRADAHRVHSDRFDPNEIEGASLLSIKTGGCSEDCAYCPQSARHQTGLESQALLSTDEIVSAARDAKAAGASRFWMGAAWRSPTDRQVDAVADAVREVAALELQTCATLGMLTEGQAAALATAGLDYYNYNLDTSPEFYGEVITTRTYDDRLATIANVRAAGVNLCCGGIVGMGASRDDRAGLLHQLASMDPHPESVPINLLVQVPGTPLDDVEPVDGLELVRTIAAARLLMPHSEVRLSAGRESMSDELQRLCLHAGANSIFLGEKLLTAPNAGPGHDHQLLDKLGMRPASEPVGRRRIVV